MPLGCSNVHLWNPTNPHTPCHLASLNALFHFLTNRCFYQREFLYSLSSVASALPHNGGILGHNFIQIRIKNVTSLFSTLSRNIHETPPRLLMLHFAQELRAALLWVWSSIFDSDSLHRCLPRCVPECVWVLIKSLETQYLALDVFPLGRR